MLPFCNHFASPKANNFVGGSTNNRQEFPFGITQDKSNGIQVKSNVVQVCFVNSLNLCFDLIWFFYIPHYQVALRLYSLLGGHFVPLTRKQVTLRTCSERERAVKKRRVRRRWREVLHTCCLNVALSFCVCLFVCCFYLCGSLGRPFWALRKKLTLCLAAPPINTKNAKTKVIPRFKQLYELKEIYCSRWLHNQNSWRFLCSIIGKEHPVLFPIYGKLLTVEIWDLFGTFWAPWTEFYVLSLGEKDQWGFRGGQGGTQSFFCLFLNKIWYLIGPSCCPLTFQMDPACARCCSLFLPTTPLISSWWKNMNVDIFVFGFAAFLVYIF